MLGPERTLFAAAIAVMAGHIALAALPGLAGVGVGLVLVALGSGGVKANATSLVGSLYAEGDERRDAGFSLFYMGINLGALVGPLLTGLFQKEWGFHAGFALAAVGMAVAVVALVGVLIAVGVITAERLADIVAGVVLVASVAYFAVILASRQVSAVERSRVWAFVPLFVTNAVFWSLYQQQFTVVTIYSDERLDRTVLGWEMPVSWVASINPVFIIVLAGAFAALWTRMGDRQPATPLKFGLGTALMGLAFWLFLLMPSGAGSAPLLGLAGILLVFTLAELLISPVGLSLSTKLAPKAFRTQMVALYFLSVALGTTMSGRLAAYYDPTDETAFFLVIGAVAIAVGILVLLANRPIRRLMAGVH